VNMKTYRRKTREDILNNVKSKEQIGHVQKRPEATNNVMIHCEVFRPTWNVRNGAATTE
jgi:hypothetical protein